MADHAVSSNTTMIDAIDRAWRTFYAAFGVDFLVAVGFGLQQLMTTQDFATPAFWIAVGLLLLKTALTTLVSFLLRLKKEPALPTKDPVVVADGPAD